MEVHKFFVLIFVLLGVNGPSSTLSAEEKISCDEVVSALTDFMTCQPDDRNRKTIADKIITLIGRDVRDKDDVSAWLCGFIQYSDPKTIDALSMFSSLENFDSTGIATASAYPELVTFINNDIQRSSKRAETAQNLLNFYSATGFPNFPILVSESEIADAVEKLSFDAALEVFGDSAVTPSPERGSGGDVKTEHLTAALVNADTIRDFGFELIGGNNGVYMWGSYQEGELWKDPAKRKEQVRELEECTVKGVHLRDMFSRAGLLDLPRGVGAFSTCEFIIEDAMNLLSLAEKLEVDHIVSKWMEPFIGDVRSDTAVSKVCNALNVTSEQELIAQIPLLGTPEHPGSEFSVYRKFASAAMRLLRDTNAVHAINKITYYVRLAKKVGYPVLPLQVTDEEAREIARILVHRMGHSNDFQTTVEDIKNAVSLEDLKYNYHVNYRYLSTLDLFMDKIGDGNEGLLYDVFFTSFRILSRLEEYGLLMLQ